MFSYWKDHYYQVSDKFAELKRKYLELHTYNKILEQNIKDYEAQLKDSQKKCQHFSEQIDNLLGINERQQTQINNIKADFNIIKDTVDKMSTKDVFCKK